MLSDVGGQIINHSTLTWASRSVPLPSQEVVRSWLCWKLPPQAIPMATMTTTPQAFPMGPLHLHHVNYTHTHTHSPIHTLDETTLPMTTTHPQTRPAKMALSPPPPPLVL